MQDPANASMDGRATTNVRVASSPASDRRATLNESRAAEPRTPTRLSNALCVSPSVKGRCPEPLLGTVEDVNHAFAAGWSPSPTVHGSGGVYGLPSPYSRTKPLAIFKPSDEESDMRGGIGKGEACLREVAAFQLDHSGFAGVPMTTLVEGSHPALPNVTCPLSPSVQMLASGSASSSLKIGSLQQYEICKGPSGDIFHTKIASVKEAQKIAVTDIRLLNADRHSGNVLYRKRDDGLCLLVPIDHGLSLRSVASAGYMDICWLEWPQNKAPLCQEALDFILSLDIAADVQMLEALNIRGRPVHFFVASSTLLKAGAEAGLSLYDMATLCYRDDSRVSYPQDPSRLEDIVYSAISLANALLEVAEEDRADTFNALWLRLCNAGALVQFPPVETSLDDDADLTDFPEVETAPYQEWASRVMLEVVSTAGDGFDEYIESDVRTIPSVQDGSFEEYFNAFVRLLIDQEVVLFVQKS